MHMHVCVHVHVHVLVQSFPELGEYTYEAYTFFWQWITFSF